MVMVMTMMVAAMMAAVMTVIVATMTMTANDKQWWQHNNQLAHGLEKGW